MTRHLLVPGFFAALLVAVPVSAQQLSLKIEDGLVDLDATGASVRQILDEWARVGGTRIVNGERVAGAPVTLKLDRVPERQALEIILRSVAGYLTAPRAANASPGASMYDRILVLPTSTAPPPAPAAAAGNRGPTPRFVQPRPGEDRAEDQEEPTPEADPGAVFTFPQPGQFGGANGWTQPQQAAPDPANPFAPTPPQPVPFGQPGSAPFMPVQPGATPFGTPVPPGTNPFGVPVQPGMVPNPNAPGQPPPVFTFTPQTQPGTPPPNGSGVVGSPVPGVAPQPARPVQRPPRD